jgi:hypothetical protein
MMQRYRDRNAGGVANSRPPFVPRTLTLYTGGVAYFSPPFVPLSLTLYTRYTHRASCHLNHGGIKAK